MSCAIQFDCCTAAEITEMYDGTTFEGEATSTEEQCNRFATAVLTGFGVNEYKESIAMGRVEYDADAAGDCVAALRELSCSAYGLGNAIYDNGCRPFLIPKVGDGGACLQDYERTSDNCAGEENSLGADPVDGACAPMPGLGEACDDNCADGLYCKSTQQAPTGTCQTLEVDGAYCNVDDSCESDFCDDQGVCADKAPICDGQ